MSVQVEGLPHADAPVKPGAGFPVSGRAAELMRRLAMAGIARYRCAASCLTCPASVAWAASDAAVIMVRTAPA